MRAPSGGAAAWGRMLRLAQCMIRQCFDHAAFSDRSAFARLGDARQFGAQRFELSYFTFHRRELLSSDTISRIAGKVRMA